MMGGPTAFFSIRTIFNSDIEWEAEDRTLSIGYICNPEGKVCFWKRTGIGQNAGSIDRRQVHKMRCLLGLLRLAMLIMDN